MTFRLFAPRPVALTAFTLALSACGSGGKPAEPVKPAKVEAIGHESELMKLTLTPQAEQRLGIAVVKIGSGSAAQTLVAQGEVVVPATGGGVPVTAQTDLATLAVNQARADGDVARMRAELGIAQRAAARAVALVQQEAGSVRQSDEAQTAVAVARANLNAAQAQRALFGQPVASMGRSGRLWVRVAVFAADLATVDRDAAARVRELGTDGPGVPVRPVSAPPSANAAAGTTDLYYAIGDGRAGLRVGQRLSVELPVQGGTTTGLTVPQSAILRDAYGGEWVYVRTKPHVYERRRIEIGSVDGGQALLSRGLAQGDAVVTAGAAELFGTEFGAK